MVDYNNLGEQFAQTPQYQQMQAKLQQVQSRQEAPPEGAGLGERMARTAWGQMNSAVQNAGGGDSKRAESVYKSPKIGLGAFPGMPPKKGAELSEATSQSPLALGTGSARSMRALGSGAQLALHAAPEPIEARAVERSIPMGPAKHDYGDLGYGSNDDSGVWRDPVKFPPYKYDR